MSGRPLVERVIPEPDPHTPIQHFDLMSPGGPHRWHRERGAGPNVKLRSVPWAGDFVVAEFTVGKRSAVMRADVVEGIPAFIDMEQRDHLSFYLNEGLARIRHLFDVDHPLKLMHHSPSHRSSATSPVLGLGWSLTRSAEFGCRPPEPGHREPLES